MLRRWKIRSDGVKQRFNFSPLRKEIVKLYELGLSARNVGKKLKISHSRVLKILESENIDRRKIVKPILNEDYLKLTISRAYLLGVMCGDGCVFSGIENKGKWFFKSYIVHLSVKDRDFLDEFIKHFINVYGFSPKIYYRDRKNKKWSNIWVARVKRKLVYEDLARYNFGGNKWKVPNEVINSKEEIVCSFLKGFYDSEGSFIIGSRGASLSIYSTSKKGIEEVKRLTEGIGIKVSEIKIDSRPFRKNECYYFFITDRKSFRAFLNKMGFSIKRKQDRVLHYLSKLSNMRSK